MNNMARVSKLAELRDKTDRELAGVIENELDLGLHLARLAEGEKSANAADRARNRTENIYSAALKLLPKVEDSTERRRLERKLKHVREALDQVSRVRAAYS